MQMTEERQSLIIKIGLGIAAAIFVAIITIVIAHMLNPQTKSSVASTSSHASTTATTPVVAPAPTVGSTQSIDSLMSQDATSEDSINATYENNNVTSSQTTNQAATNVGSAYDESSF